MKKYLIPGVMLIALISCRQADKSEKMFAVKLIPPPALSKVKFPPPIVKADAEVTDNAEVKQYAKVENTPAATVIQDTSKKIVKQGDISFETKDIVATRKALLGTLNKLGGYADEDNESVDRENDRKEYTIKARIPAKSFDVFLDSVSAGAAKIDSKHISISDVTTQYIDMTTRLHNQKVLEATYLNLLKRASKMTDVLEVEDKLTDTRTEIESEQGQLNYLSKQIAFSSLDITFYTKQIQRETGTGAGYHLTSAFSDGWQLLQGLFFGLIAVWPLVLLFPGAFILIRSWRRKRRLQANS